MTAPRPGEAGNDPAAILLKLKVKLYADGADKAGMESLAARPYIRGFTTNPSLMRKAGVTDVEAFAKEVIAAIPDRSISFEVFSDEPSEMERQARKISSWGTHVFAKIPVMNTRRESTAALVRKLSAEGINLNVTAILTLEQVKEVAAALTPGVDSIVSVFAGRIADTGVDPMPIMIEAARILRPQLAHELLWASTRETLNIFQAEQAGAAIITVPHDILGKLGNLGTPLIDYSHDTVQTFFDDAKKSGFSL